MSLKEQYEGFLESSPIWLEDSLFGLSQFTKLPSKHLTIPNKLAIEIPKNQVLGKRIERLFEYYIDTSDRYTLIAKNIQIFKNKVTLGELDFLLRDTKINKDIHIELVYKFYVYDPKLPEEYDRWIGPNRKDSFIYKIEKLKNKQLPLLHREETNQVLQDLNLKQTEIEQKVCFLGHLYVPLHMKHHNFSYVNPECIKGYWLHFEDIKQQQNKNNLFFIPKKQDWVTHPRHNIVWHSFDKIEAELTHSIAQKKSPLLWIKSGENSFERLFIVWW